MVLLTPPLYSESWTAANLATQSNCGRGPRGSNISIFDIMIHDGGQQSTTRRTWWLIDVNQLDFCVNYIALCLNKFYIAVMPFSNKPNMVMQKLQDRKQEKWTSKDEITLTMKKHNMPWIIVKKTQLKWNKITTIAVRFTPIKVGVPLL